MRQIEYTFQEFRDHVKAMRHVLDYEVIFSGGPLLHIGSDKSFDLNILRVFDYMNQIYTDKDEINFKTIRFLLILTYIAEHLGEFDTGNFAVKGSLQALLGEHLLKAVHHIFTSNELGKLGHGPEPKYVLELAASFESGDK